MCAQLLKKLQPKAVRGVAAHSSSEDKVQLQWALHPQPDHGIFLILARSHQSTCLSPSGEGLALIPRYFWQALRPKFHMWQSMGQGSFLAAANPFFWADEGSEAGVAVREPGGVGAAAAPARRGPSCRLTLHRRAKSSAPSSTAVAKAQPRTTLQRPTAQSGKVSVGLGSAFALVLRPARLARPGPALPCRIRPCPALPLPARRCRCRQGAGAGGKGWRKRSEPAAVAAAQERLHAALSACWKTVLWQR